MPCPSQPSLLSSAVQTLYERTAGDERTGRDERSPLEPLAFALERHDDQWTVQERRPVTDLIGWRASPSCWAIAIVVSGQAWHLDGPAHDITPHPDSLPHPAGPPLPDGPAHHDGPAHQDGTPHPDGTRLTSRSGGVSGSAGPAHHDGPARPDGVSGSAGPHAPDNGCDDCGPVRLAVGIDRAGEVAGRLGAHGRVRDHAPEGGRLLDTLRRNLGLATPPAPEGTGRFLAVLWLGAVLEAAVSAGSPLGWRAVIGLHPAGRLLLRHGERLRSQDLEGIVAITPSTWTWDVLREAEMRQSSITPMCPPGAARWMDTGMYARWVLADLPGPEWLWHRLRHRLTPDARRHLRRCLQSSGVALDTVHHDVAPAARAQSNDREAHGAVTAREAHGAVAARQVGGALRARS